MTLKNSKRLLALILLAALALASVSSLILMHAYAQSSLDGDGTYTVPVDLDGLKMGADNFTSTATLEKYGDFYFFSFGHSQSIENLTLDCGDKTAGFTVKTENGMTIYTYTMSYSRLSSEIPFKAHISAMGKDVSFSVKLKLDEAKKTSDSISDIGERPAEFVPTIITTAASSYSLKKGTSFPLPSVTAIFGSAPCDITVTATYGDELIDITNGILKLDKIGTYKVIYRASCDKYKTMLGNDSYTEYSVLVHSSADDNDIVKLNDKNGILGENCSVIAGKLDFSSTLYEKAASAMSSIADDFEVFSVELVSDDGTPVTITEEISYLILADGYFDRTSAEAYYMNDNGELTKLTTSNCGRYISVNTNKTGTFIICTPGVAFTMPMWGYAVIAVSILLIIFIAVSSIIITVHRKRKAH